MLFRSLGIALIATNDAHYLSRHDVEAHDALLCVLTGKLVTDEKRLRYTGTEYIKSEEEMAALFADDAKFSAWLEVEILACEGWAELGVVPVDHAAAIRERASFSTEAVLEREKTTDHDVAAFVDVVQASVGAPAGVWVHYGLTSTDVVDTAQS